MPIETRFHAYAGAAGIGISQAVRSRDRLTLRGRWWHSREGEHSGGRRCITVGFGSLGGPARRWSQAWLLGEFWPGRNRQGRCPGRPRLTNKTGCCIAGFTTRRRHCRTSSSAIPRDFVEPPLGYYVKEQMTLQVSKADPHRFTVYRTDFLPGTNRFSPVGAYRFNLMYSRLGGWLGPVIVEWTPDEPGLAEARRQAVLGTLQTAGRPIVPERVVIGPSPYPGAMGAETGNNFNTLLTRSQQAALAYPPTPQSGAYAYGSAGGSR